MQGLGFDNLGHPVSSLGPNVPCTSAFSTGIKGRSAVDSAASSRAMQKAWKLVPQSLREKMGSKVP
jgi:hypothetical protein